MLCVHVSSRACLPWSFYRGWFDVVQRNMQASFLNEKEVVQKAGKERINDFLRNHVCYDLLKHSGKVRSLYRCIVPPCLFRMGITDFW